MLFLIYDCCTTCIIYYLPFTMVVGTTHKCHNNSTPWTLPPRTYTITCLSFCSQRFFPIYNVLVFQPCVFPCTDQAKLSYDLTCFSGVYYRKNFITEKKTYNIYNLPSSNIMSLNLSCLIFN